MPRRFAIVACALVAACGGADDGDDGGDVVDRDRAVPADVQAFVDRVVDASAIELGATYAVLNKNGGSQHSVEVTSPPLAVRIDGVAVDLADEPALARFGIFSGFLDDNPKAAILAAARRADAGDAVFSERDGMDCIAVPIGGTTTSTWCLLDVGLFGYVDTPSVRYEITTP